MNAKAKVSIAASLALICAAAATYYTAALPFLSVSTPEAAKEQIKANFLADQRGFDFDSASLLLSESRVENEYAVCSATAEATADQYVELSGLIDKHAEKAPGLKIAMNAALRGSAGVSDCDYRVMETLIYSVGKNKQAEQSVVHSASAVKLGASR